MASIDLSTILSAGVTSAVVSACVSFFTSWLTYRYNRKKDRFQLLRPRLEKFAHDIQATSKLVFGGNLGELQRTVERGDAKAEHFVDFISGPFRQAMDGLTAIRDIYTREKYLLAKSDAAVLDQRLQLFDETNLAVRRRVEAGVNDSETAEKMMSLYPQAIEFISGLDRAVELKSILVYDIPLAW